MIAPAPADLGAERVLALLGTRRLGRRYHLIASCGSTNDEAAALGRADAPDGTLVVADRQTGGRGRLGRSWHAPAGENLTFSLLLRPPLEASAVPPITLLAGAVVAAALAQAGVSPRLKWPNDVLLATPDGARKVAGVLTEMASERDRARHVVLGIGLNVNTIAFPPELEGRATSLRLATGRAHDRGALLAAVIDALEPLYDDFVASGPAAALDLWRAFGALGQHCRIDREDGPIEGLAVDLDADGALIVRDAAGALHRVVSGEIAPA